MGNVRVIDVHQSVYAVNDEIAAKTRARLKEEKTFMVNLMSSPGAGKTTTLIRTANMLGDRYRIGVMEADIDSSVDAEKMAAAGVTSIQVHTGGECAMDAHMTMQALDEFDTEGLDLLVMEKYVRLRQTQEHRVMSLFFRILRVMISHLNILLCSRCVM